MVPQLARVARHYGIPVCSGGGFDSLTAKVEGGQPRRRRRTALRGCSTSATSTPRACICSARPLRTSRRGPSTGTPPWPSSGSLSRPEQIERYDLPTAPPKATDKRSFEGNQTCQAEALDPADLATEVTSAIERHIDVGISEPAHRGGGDRAGRDHRQPRRRRPR